MKKTSKIIVFILIAMMIVSIGTTTVFAEAIKGGTDPSTLKGQAVTGTNKIRKPINYNNFYSWICSSSNCFDCIRS